MGNRASAEEQGTPVGPAPTVDEAGRALIERHAAWWQRQGLLYAESHGGPLGDLWLPLSDGTLATEDLEVTPEMLDIERLVGEALPPGDLEINGDAFAVRSPYARVPWVEAILGCPIRATIQGGSMRTESFIESWDEWEGQGEHWHQEWFDTLMALTEALAARSGGRYGVVQTLMRGPTDLAEAVLGPERMCLAMYDAPDSLRAFLDEATEVFIKVLHAQLARIPRVEEGYVNSFGIWAPGKVVRTQCDASAILSPKQYAEWFLPYDVLICESVECAMIHLHSCSLHTVEPLMTVDTPQAIQVTLETGPAVPTLDEMIPIFRRALEKKRLLVDGPLTDDEVARLKRELPNEGLYIRARKQAW